MRSLRERLELPLIVGVVSFMYLVAVPLGILWSQPGWQGWVAAGIVWAVCVPIFILVVLTAWSNRR